MKIQNIKDAQDTIEQFEELQKRAAKVATQLIALKHREKYHVDPEEITLEDGVLYADWETYCCGESDPHQVVIPLHYLFDEEWQAEAEVTIQREREEAAERERIRKEKADQAAKEREHKKYLELKAKYEGGA